MRPVTMLTLAACLLVTAPLADASTVYQANQEGRSTDEWGYVTGTYTTGQSGPFTGTVRSTCRFDLQDAGTGDRFVTLVGIARAEANGPLDRPVSVGVRCALLDGLGQTVLTSQAAESGSVGHTSSAAIIAAGEYTICTEPSGMWSSGAFLRLGEVCQAYSGPYGGLL